ncbi:YigZ family protein [Clostridium algidicarnis]|uniref:YigZ family protein n=1 Tax=Clostridium algidicarnis TaxID=37659 RepID=UPI001C0D6C20|nr:YigZ family protein [Clostridium algidicarnis]MBU3195755.1 YigZ family protein [Clostridium algidicarnis]MBU3208777.1 YigZ family protein [Clostridium algidicarnis]MBU3226712.1 YigZ family protein [Clostridium algidicarnis]MBU3250377.1 YigZ family protein [Clostridium algidicarnis]
MKYITVKQEASDEFKEKRSLFIGYIKRIEEEEEAKDFIEHIKSKHKDATHNVYAYIVGKNLEIQRYSDDGEPQGTAGVPILEVIKKTGITDCVIVVTRYFGGTLLGAGGLIRAYTKGASLAIKKAGIVEKVSGILLKFILEYESLGKVQFICNENKWHIEDILYTDKVEINIYSEIEKIEIIETKIIDATSGKVTVIKSEKDMFFKQGNRLFKNI